MNYTFSWNNVNCSTKGIHLVDAIPLIEPNQRITFHDIPGRSGSLTQLEGRQVYDDFTISLNCWLDDGANAGTVAAWLCGSGELRISNRAGGHYKATVVEMMQFEKAMHGKAQHTFTVSFRCKPFFYADNVTDISVTTSGTTVTNPGTVFSEPEITVTGTGDITLVMGATSVILTGVTNPIKLDSELQEAFVGALLANDQMSGEFPILLPGQNTVSWIGSVTKVEIKPRWRSL